LRMLLWKSDKQNYMGVEKWVESLSY
jgi:hypothetical protein